MNILSNIVNTIFVFLLLSFVLDVLAGRASHRRWKDGNLKLRKRKRNK